MNEAPILLRIASYCDMKTLLNFMTVNKKCYSVFKYIVRNAPTVFIAKYFIDTNGTLPKKVIYKSLKELFTELHQYHLNNPQCITDVRIGKQRKDCGNLSGPCFDCLEDSEFYPCNCDDIGYKGIKMVKYLSNESSEEKEKIIKTYQANGWCTRLSYLPNNAKGFRMSLILNNLYNDTYTLTKSKYINYRSMEYLYFGCKKFSIMFKNGIRKKCLDKKKYCSMYYSATTDILPFIRFGYLPNDKADFKEYHNISFIDPDVWTRRINTI